jgi:hypothetical protein
MIRIKKRPDVNFDHFSQTYNFGTSSFQSAASPRHITSRAHDS